jgi:hypothetical protein
MSTVIRVPNLSKVYVHTETSILVSEQISAERVVIDGHEWFLFSKCVESKFESHKRLLVTAPGTVERRIDVSSKVQYSDEYVQYRVIS